ncbi:ABC transporter ATP-binding protein [Rhodococcus pyridinivorans]
MTAVELPSTTTLLSIRDAELEFPNGTRALESVDLDVSRGEFVSIVGPSGCGKSTLLRVVSGLTDCTAGDVAVNTETIGYVFQEATLLPWRSVRDNVALLAELDGLSKTERYGRADIALDLVGLREFGKHLPHQLSGGMRMRASVARSLTLAPELFLFDEPFGALDEITRQRLNEELAGLFHSQGFGAVLVTHSVTEAVFLSTRVIVMSGRPGTIVEEIEIPFAYPREPSIQFDPEFIAIAERVSTALREAHS